MGRRQFVLQMMEPEQKEQPDSKLVLPHSSPRSLFVSFAAEAALPELELVSLAIEDDTPHPNHRVLLHSLIDWRMPQQQYCLFPIEEQTVQHELKKDAQIN